MHLYISNCRRLAPNQISKSFKISRAFLKCFLRICDEMKLQIRGIHGEHSETEGGVYDISNKARLGLTEFEGKLIYKIMRVYLKYNQNMFTFLKFYKNFFSFSAVKQMYDGVKKLIELEKAA